MPYIPKRFNEEEQYLFWEKSPNDMGEKDLEQLIEAAKAGKRIVINGFLPKEKLLATRKEPKGRLGPRPFKEAKSLESITAEIKELFDVPKETILFGFGDPPPIDTPCDIYVQIRGEAAEYLYKNGRSWANWNREEDTKNAIKPNPDGVKWPLFVLKALRNGISAGKIEPAESLIIPPLNPEEKKILNNEMKEGLESAISYLEKKWLINSEA